MNTAMSSKRSIVSSRFASGFSTPTRASDYTYASLALVAGVLIMIIGVAVNISVLMVVGSFTIMSAFLTLNCLFWASYYTKHPVQLSERWKRGGYGL